MMKLKAENLNIVKEIGLKEPNWKEEREKELDQAAYRLSDEMFPIRDKIEKACLLLQDITDDYFRIYDREDEEDHWKIVWEYPRYATIADIIDDYVFQARDLIRELEKRGDKVSREKHERGLRNE